MERNKLIISTFNCRSVKSSVSEIKQLCDQCDIVLLQEHWLLPNDLDYLSNIHHEFLSHARSTVDLSNELLVGRPYGGTAVLYKKNLMPSITTVETFDPRVCAVHVNSNHGPILLMCVYMPTDEGNNDCLESYIATCAKITALIAECDAAQVIVAGDFNCQPGSRFYSIFQKLVTDNNLYVSDQIRMTGAFTYYNDAGTASSWIDHVLCSQGLDSLIDNVAICMEYISSDHKPVVISLSQVAVVNALNITERVINSELQRPIPDWSKADAISIFSYQSTLNALLDDIQIPNDAIY